MYCITSAARHVAQLRCVTTPTDILELIRRLRVSSIIIAALLSWEAFQLPLDDMLSAVELLCIPPRRGV